jgi:hypothetical protein
MPPNNLDINQVPKQFSEQMVVGSNNQFFVLIPIAGTNATAYAITPEHAKVLAKTLTEHVENFEKNVRKIDIGGMPSPIQRSDLPPSDQGKTK